MNKKNEINKNIYGNEKVSNSIEKPKIPEKKFRAGAISATLWKNQGLIDGEKTEYTTVTFERSYKDKEGNWQKTNSLRVNDLPKASTVLQHAYEEIVLKEFTDSPLKEESVNI